MYEYATQIGQVARCLKYGKPDDLVDQEEERYNRQHIWEVTRLKLVDGDYIQAKRLTESLDRSPAARHYDSCRAHRLFLEDELMVLSTPASAWPQHVGKVRRWLDAMGVPR